MSSVYKEVNQEHNDLLGTVSDINTVLNETLPSVLFRRGNPKFNEIVGIKSYTTPKTHVEKTEIVVKESQGTACVIYNKMNEDSLLAAIIYKTGMTKQDRDVFMVDITEQMPVKADKLVWLGVDPSDYKEHYNFISKVENEVYHSKYPEVTKNIGSIFKRNYLHVYPSPLNQDIDAQYSDKPVFKVADSVVYEFEASEFRALMFRIAMFFDPKAKLELHEAAAIYKTIKNIHRSLTKGEDLQIVTSDLTKANKGYVDEYLKDVEEVKDKLRVKLSSTSIVGSSKKRKYLLYTNFNDIEFLLVKRLMILSNREYINVSYGLTGHFVLTNLKDITPKEIKEQLK